ncbi:MAG: lipoprotein-releasing system permease protein [Limisphaerales bacterium]
MRSFVVARHHANGKVTFTRKAWRLSDYMRKHSSNSIFLPLFIARRYLIAQTHAFSNVGRLAFAGLVLSISVLVVVISVVNGFERELRERVLGLIPTLTIVQSPGKTDVGDALRALEQMHQVKSSPFIAGQILLAKDNQLVGAQLTGIDPIRYADVTRLFEFTSTQSPAVLESEKFGIVIGVGLAATLQAEIGDQVRLVIPAAGVSAAGAVPRQRSMKVVDILNSQSLLDGQAAYVHIDIAKRLFRLRAPQGVHMKTPDIFDFSLVSRDVYAAFGSDVRISSWMDRYGSLYQAVAVQKLTMFVLLLFLVAVAAFNLVSGLVMIVEQRKADVAVLTTLGLGRAGILMLFVFLGLTMAVTGIVIGLAVGTVVALALPSLFAFAANALQTDLMSQYFINYLPSEVRFDDILKIALTSFAMALAATIFPAWRATRLMPSEVLNHE